MTLSFYFSGAHFVDAITTFYLILAFVRRLLFRNLFSSFVVIIYLMRLEQMFSISIWADIINSVILKTVEFMFGIEFIYYERFIFENNELFPRHVPYITEETVKLFYVFLLIFWIFRCCSQFLLHFLFVI